MGCAMRVHKILGDGFLESAYGDALELEFKRHGIPYVREDELCVFYIFLNKEEAWRKLPPDLKTQRESFWVAVKETRS